MAAAARDDLVVGGTLVVHDVAEQVSPQRDQSDERGAVGDTRALFNGLPRVPGDLRIQVPDRDRTVGCHML